VCFPIYGGGCLMNQGVHWVDLIQWLVGPVAQVQAYTDTFAHQIEVEDAAVAAVRFTSGALGLIMGSTVTYKARPTRIEVQGEKGNVIIEGDVITQWQVGDEEETGAAAAATSAADPMAGLADAVDAHVEQITDVLRAAEENRDPALSGEEARAPVAVVLAIYESARTGRPVVPG
jgi:predicted dehydrogenase